MSRLITLAFSVAVGILPLSAQTWTRQSVPTAETLRSIFFINSNEGWAAGYGPQIYHTTNGGTTWIQQSPGIPSPIPLTSIRFTDANNGWAGAGEDIVRTTNGGARWFRNSGLYPGAGPFRSTLYPVSATVAWAPATDGTFLWFYRYTVNGSTSVLEETFNPVVSWSAQCDMSFIDVNTGWSVGTYGEMWKITNASTAAPVFIEQTNASVVSSHLFGVSFVDASHGWAVGDKGVIIRTTNGGSLWTRLVSGTTSDLRDVCFSDTARGIAVGDSGTMLLTTNGGSTWTPQLSGVTTMLFAIQYVSGSLWFAAGGDWGTSGNGVILRSGIGMPPAPTLAGPVDSARNLPLYALLSWNTVAGANGYHLQLSLASDFGTTVISDSTLTSVSRVVGLLTLATTYYWRVRAKNESGWGAYSSVRQFTTIRTTLVEQLAGMPIEYSLRQNHPNPFNPTTTISFSLPSRSFVSLDVFDALGREVSVLLAEELSAGIYSRHWNETNVPSGIYFYRLQARQVDGGQAGDASTGSARGFVETKKMILLK
jgi:photosystem II stability/assembly factor-like uncharacterized protein